MWRNIKNLVLKKENKIIEKITFEIRVVNDKHELERYLNKYFPDSIHRINAEIPHMEFQNLKSRTYTKLKFEEISLFGVKTVLSKMINKKDYNTMVVAFILNTFNTTGPIILNIINNSFASGIIPERWKESIVVPIEKVKNAICKTILRVTIFS